MEPIPFTTLTKERFPVEALPKPIADYVSAVSESTQTPLDMAGALSIAVMSTCLQGKFLVQGPHEAVSPEGSFVIVQGLQVDPLAGRGNSFSDMIAVFPVDPAAPFHASFKEQLPDKFRLIHDPQKF